MNLIMMLKFVSVNVMSKLHSNQSVRIVLKNCPICGKGVFMPISRYWYDDCMSQRNLGVND